MNEKMKSREARLRQSFLKHAALAQVYRWWDYNHTPPYDPALLLDLLVEDALVTNEGNWDGQGDPSANFGSASDRQRLHCLSAPTVEVQIDGSVSIRADLERISARSGSDAGAYRSTARFYGLLRPARSVLPRITDSRIVYEDLRQGDSVRSDAENRIRSLVHYFTALVENPQRDPCPFLELLAPGFRLDFTDPPIDSIDALTAWVAGPLSSVIASQHAIDELLLLQTADCEYLLNIGMRSEALFPDGSSVTSRNTQNWRITDGHERFARIRSISIERHELQRYPAEA